MDFVDMPNLARLEQKRKEWQNEINKVEVVSVLQSEFERYFKPNTLGLIMKLVFRDEWKLKQFAEGKAKLSSSPIYHYENRFGHNVGCFCLR